jgi:hypothetical protein
MEHHDVNIFIPIPFFKSYPHTAQKFSEPIICRDSRLLDPIWVFVEVVL